MTEGTPYCCGWGPCFLGLCSTRRGNNNKNNNNDNSKAVSPRDAASLRASSFSELVFQLADSRSELPVLLLRLLVDSNAV